jgi:hypothetical protein
MRWEVFSASPVPPFGVVSYSVLLWRPLSNHLVYRLCSSVLVGRSFGSSWLVVVQICSGGLLRWCLCFQLPSRLPALVSLESLKVGGGDAILPCSVFQNPWGSVPFRCLWLFIVFNLCRSEQCSSLLCWRAVSVVVCNTVPSFSKDRVRACRVLFKRLWLGFSLDSRCCRRCCSDPCSLVASVLFFGSDILQWFGFDWLERVVYACSDLSEGLWCVNLSVLAVSLFALSYLSKCLHIIFCYLVSRPLVGSLGSVRCVGVCFGCLPVGVGSITTCSWI